MAIISEEGDFKGPVPRCRGVYLFGPVLARVPYLVGPSEVDPFWRPRTREGNPDASQLPRATVDRGDPPRDEAAD